jgi:hypothetical protein
MSNILEFFTKRLPEKKEITLALAGLTFLVFGWELRTLFFNFPAFLLSYTVGEILSIAAYMLSFALLETAIVMVFALFVAIILPHKLFAEGFSYKAFFLFVGMATISIHLQYVMNNQPKISFLVRELAIGLAIWILFSLLTYFVPIVKKIVLDILDRLTIFSYIYIPLGFLSLFVVTFRLLW